ncbi:hypothetical protein E2C01_020262 [Portunus trituberculatus]|uniref:Uncharacterized protein n=1 Tax=Portunus trituberculatus TaxID=210409 RepID=A0A5B7E2P5_PORTR|nr:hypothetical protein [Portunus trituberculatus]
MKSFMGPLETRGPNVKIGGRNMGERKKKVLCNEAVRGEKACSQQDQLSTCYENYGIRQQDM